MSKQAGFFEGSLKDYWIIKGAQLAKKKKRFQFGGTFKGPFNLNSEIRLNLSA